MSSKFSYGQGLAVMVLAAHRMGLSPSLVHQSTDVLNGEAVHATTSSAIEREACRINDAIREAHRFTEANQHARAVSAQFGI